MNAKMPDIFALLTLLFMSACQPAAPPPAPTSTFAPPTPTAAPLPTAAVKTQPLATPTPAPIPHPLLGDLRLRQALAYCTDRLALVQAVYPWLDQPASLLADSFVPPGHWAYIGDDPAFIRYPFSPQQGIALLEEAGWNLASGAAYRANAQGEELESLVLTTSDSSFRKTWTQAWAEQMKACGIRILLDYRPAEWFFGEETGLSRRDFEIAAFAWQSEFDAGGLKAASRYACEQIPSPANNWQGQNYSAWCDPSASAALELAAGTLDITGQRQSYHTVQREYARQVPELPLFYRLSVFASNPALENFSPPDDGMHTWNAAQWRIPGKDTIVIGEDGEPAAPLWFEQAYVAGVIRTLIMGSDFIRRGYQYQPVLLKRLPDFENGGAGANPVVVNERDQVVDWGGVVIELHPGALVRDAQGQKLVYAGGELDMRQLVVTYEFVDGLTWSDGVPVSSLDYELAYQAMCDPALRGEGPFGGGSFDPAPACDRIASVDFLSDTAYQVTWLPGFTGARLVYADLPYFLPPFSRLPAHQEVYGGRKLADVPVGEWSGLDEVLSSPLGVGPYVLKEWVYGQSMALEANPHYFLGPPATQRIVIKFLEHDQALRALLAGEVDVLDWETIGPQDVEAFAVAQAQQDGKVRLVTLPASSWELLNFALSLP